MAAQINIRDIADKAGLSISTVSRVLNGKAKEYRIGKKSQEKVIKIAKELNYVPNQFAANLKSGKSKTIALIVPSLNNPFFAEIASRINTEIRKYGYITIIGETGEDQEIEKKELQQLMSRNIEGLIIVPCGNQWEHINNLYTQDFPIVCIDRYFEDLKIPFVSINNYESSFLATKYFVDNGHKNIACIQGVKESNTNILRVEGFKAALNESDIESSNIVGNDFTVKNGYKETKHLLQQEQRPTAILALSNTIAMGCMKAFKEADISVPDDISLITFDDHPYLDYLATPLTCIAHPIKDISKKAVKFIFSILTDKKLRSDQVLLKPKMKIRSSVKAID
ncbi:LacI family DNA-binding transcriptional regulator [Maribacter sp. ANRC-HE7]|uniref:LacI family DNA-binding transcriptional regulator n=1 Tax=Maribacter aquimaris TaxID=2737171 RepID=A0ABR7V0K3_9FLAO|nr:LacI family DNA-binding transcriptional regulator [Maribacter aquimaris]MBD0777850.1 LacI family DNA-binding transcriptional regulator [Maribacter aquimaris]